ncbi:MAG: DUF1800 domain-containing protein, partial [Anaerolineae bacterium]|nr:DUF1800 domain-containing protein [Anaerolineae bacterium]
MDNLNRRDFLKLSGLTAAMTALAACRPLIQQPPTSPPSPTALPSPSPKPRYDDWLIHRTLHRITFGPRPEEIARAKEIGIDNFIDEQLAPDTIPDTAVPPLLTGLSTLNSPPSQLINTDPPNLPVTELVTATLLRAVHSKRQLYEMMVDFWTNHFNIYISPAPERFLKLQDDRDVIRQHAMGSFGDLLSASAKSPAMLTYLDNAASTKDRPNENYARELLELHTLGVDGGYTHFDLQEVARAFTGWSTGSPRFNRRRIGDFIYRPELHDDGPKTILGRQLPAGQGISDGEQILDILVEHPSTAEFIAAKLARRFVADVPPAPLVASAAAAFTQSRGDIAKVMGVILHSSEFKDSLGQKLKRPLEVFVSALRLTNADFSADRRLDVSMVQMGQPLFRWPTPDGYPD